MMIFACVNKGTFIYLQFLGKAWTSTLLSMMQMVQKSGTPLLFTGMSRDSGVYHYLLHSDVQIWQGRTRWMQTKQRKPGAPREPSEAGRVGKGEKALTDGEAPLAGIRHLQGLFDVAQWEGFEPSGGL